MVVLAGLEKLAGCRFALVVGPLGVGPFSELPILELFCKVGRVVSIF